MRRLDDPEVVRRECADEHGLAPRMAARAASATGPDPDAVVFEAVARRLVFSRDVAVFACER